MPELINLNEIKQAQSNTHRLIRKTPLVPFANSIEENTPDLLYLKLENLQITNSYKSRAAFHVMSSLNSEQREKGIVMTSSGNFAKAFALAGFVYNVKYENLVKNTKIEIKKLLKFCDLDWSDKCLKFYNNKRPIKTASDTQARSKIYKSSINSWKNYEEYLNKYFFKLRD